MRSYEKLEKQILDQRLKDFQYEVIPDELFPFLRCLIPEDKEAIKAEQTNRGPIRATAVLVDRLKRRHGFQDFVKALRKYGSEHTALLLNPNYNFRGKYFKKYHNSSNMLGFDEIYTSLRF